MSSRVLESGVFSRESSPVIEMCGFIVDYHLSWPVTGQYFPRFYRHGETVQRLPFTFIAHFLRPVTLVKEYRYFPVSEQLQSNESQPIKTD